VSVVSVTAFYSGEQKPLVLSPQRSISILPKVPLEIYLTLEFNLIDLLPTLEKPALKSIEKIAKNAFFQLAKHAQIQRRNKNQHPKTNLLRR
jgi:hypothetical protein